MIEHLHLAKLHPDRCHDAGRDEAAREARELLSPLPGLHSLHVGLPADAASLKSWDVAIIARFAGPAHADAFAQDARYQAWLTVALPKHAQVIKHWRFQLQA
jgi:hypothetical protein